MAERMNANALSLPDTDWHVTRLYEFAKDLGASVISARYSRYVVDLNRSADDENLYANQVATGLCPTKTFAGDPLYTIGESINTGERLRNYWQPYHDELRTTLAELRERFGYALLWDAHSIRSEVPRLFEGQLPDLNFGTNSGASCAASIEQALREAMKKSEAYSCVLNGRFKGGYITRRYGAPLHNIHAVQLEIAQHCYMNETIFEYDEKLADKLAATIEGVIRAYTAAGERACTNKK